MVTLFIYFLEVLLHYTIESLPSLSIGLFIAGFVYAFVPAHIAERKSQILQK
ncbi:MAG: hypothetical protein QMC98_03550 [Candidatus Thermoplasmatota archaeon]|nr:hypothetical protein [Candidatus Thermoplasmatota archaeon]